MEDSKSQGQLLQEQLSDSKKNAWEELDEEVKSKAFSFCEEYKSFLNCAKTEREFVHEVEKLAKENGYTEITALEGKPKLLPGMKVYQKIKNKAVILSKIGNKKLECGVNIIGAHIDSPRMDLKQNPLFEDTEMAFLKTHYYGEIKKYQWVTIPLSIHGVIVKNDGGLIKVCIGEEDSDPVFTVTDLLPHLAYDQMQKKMSEGITGEGLNLLFGSIPYNDKKVESRVKLNILKLLNDKYGIVEQDFVSAELEIVPAFKAKDVGFDRSMIGAYGQDDRVCAYGALKAILNTGSINTTAVCLLTDKEEIGSVGSTGAESKILENFIATLCSYAEPEYNDIAFRKCLANTKMLSSDVTPGVDPNFEGVQEKRNASFIGRGLVIQKYTGMWGKCGSNDANAEFVGEIRKTLNDAKIIWQAGELGKVDQGGSGTIARYIANLGADVLDCGVPVLSMHSPFEVTSKIDVYINFKADCAFFEV